MQITGVSRTTGEIRTFDSSEVYKIVLEKKIPVFYTKYGVFYQIVTLDVFQKGLSEHDFILLDPTNLVNMKHVDHITKEYVVCFKGTDIKADTNKHKVKEYDLEHLIRL